MPDIPASLPPPFSQSDHIILNDIEPDFNLEYIAARLRQWSACSEKALLHLAWEARKIAKPQAALKLCRVSFNPPTEISLNGVRFQSPALMEKVAGLETVFAFVATEGQELEDWGASYSGIKSVLARIIRYAALMLAEKEAADILRGRFFGLAPLSVLKPGVGNGWPLEQQKALFQILSPLPEKIGVSLRPDCWMTPHIAASGLLFPAEITLYQC